VCTCLEKAPQAPRSGTSAPVAFERPLGGRGADAGGGGSQEEAAAVRARGGGGRGGGD
jgi:hypothetical protein